MSISVTGHGKFAKQTGGRGQYGHVVVRVTVNDANAGMMVVHQQGAAIPEQFVPAVENGIRTYIAGGHLAERGYSGAIVEVTDGSWHETDSSERAFYTAAVMAMDDALRQLPRRPGSAEGDDSPGVREPRTPRGPAPASSTALPEPFDRG